MRFLDTIIGKTSTRAPLRRSHENIADRLRKTQMSDDLDRADTPKFSRNSKRIVRKPVTSLREDAPLSEILDQWKKDADQDAAAPAEKDVTEPEPAPEKSVARVKTRLLGFDDVAAPDPFEKTKTASNAAPTRYPVGWLVITDGPGRGESFTLLTGMSQIGRAEDQAVTLDFGDEAISRSNHAAIVYDIETHSFMMGHGGKANVVRLNNKPLISTETLKSGDKIRIGETSLQLVVFSTPEFNWATPQTSDEADDVATS